MKSNPFRARGLVDRGGWRRIGAVLLASTALGLAGCTVVPKPMTLDERASEAATDLHDIYAEQEPLKGPLTLEQAFARALKYNLDARSKMMEETLAQDDLDISRLDMLPKALVEAGYTTRDRVDASSSTSVITPSQQTVPPSTSSDINRRAYDLNLSWNILDFGVSYVSARQQGDRKLVAVEERRRVVQNLMSEVRRAFWRAASAQRLSKKVRDAIKAAEAALPAARKVETEALRSPVESLRYQKLLLDLLRQLESVERLLETSKTELAALINLPPGKPFSVAIPSGSRGLAPVRMHVRDMEEVALLLNPDIRSMSYQGRISIDDSRKALLKLLPGISLSYSPNYDSNSFLYHNYWTAGAVRASGYINNLIQAPYQIKRAGNNEILANEKRKAISVATLAKLHIAYEQYLSAAREYRWSNQLASVDDRLYEQITNRASSDVQSELERISAQVSAVNSELRRDQSYAEAQAALGRIYASMGLDPAGDGSTELSVKELSHEIAKTMRDWQKVNSKALLANAAAKTEPAP